MSSQYYIYTFTFNGDTFEIDDQNGTVLKNNDEEIPLTGKQFDVLKLLLKNHQTKVKKETFFKKVWEDTFVEDQNLTKLISEINKALKCKGIIKTTRKTRNSKSDNGGYKFDQFVTITEKQNEDSVLGNSSEDIETKTEPQFLPNENLEETAASKIEIESQSFGKRNTVISSIGTFFSLVGITVGIVFRNNSPDYLEKTFFIVTASILYGCLAGIGVVLESAYQFDKYGWNASLMAIVISALNIGAMFCGLSVTNSLLQSNGNLAFGAGFLSLLIGVIFSSILAYFVLPNIPITAATFQTQAAFAAFCKNIFVYFLPTYTIFGLLIFCFIYSPAKLTKNIGFPIALAIIWLVFFAISFISTNYLSDNLLTKQDGQEYKYHGLFSTLLFFRMIFCFLPTFCAIIWYFLKLINYTSANE